VAEQPVAELKIPRRRTLLGRATAWAEHAEALRARTARARRRWPLVDATFATIDRDSELGGGMLAGALSYRLFVFALPLCFFLVSGGGLLASALGVEPRAVPNSVGFAGAISKQVASGSSKASNWWVALGALFVLAYAMRVLFRAVSIAHALAWERSASSVKVRTRDLGVFAAVVVGQIALGAAVGAVRHQNEGAGLVMLLVYVAVAAGMWLAVSLHVPHSDARWQELIPGALLYGIGLSAIAFFNVVILGRLIQSKAQTYGALGIAATLLLGFFFLGRIMVGAAMLNATLHERRRT
jgi:membrane protein